jgi:hypothetical protein
MTTATKPSNEGSNMKQEVIDRYDALGIPHPDPENVCGGQCEGTGVVPVKGSTEDDPELTRRWEEAEAKKPAKDGWHFVTCPTCNGSGTAQ